MSAAGASETPPGSPKKQSLGALAHPTSRSNSPAADVTATSADKLSSKAAGQRQQQQIQVSAAEYSPPSEAEMSADKFYSITGGQGTTVSVNSTAAAPTAGSVIVHDEADEDEFLDQDDESQQEMYSSVSNATSAAAEPSSRQLPYSDEQLQVLIGGSLNRQYWEPIHEGTGSVRDVYSIRGPNYLRDKKKIPAGKLLPI